MWNVRGRLLECSWNISTEVPADCVLELCLEVVIGELHGKLHGKFYDLLL